MIYYAHTANRADGTPEPDKSRWQPLYTGDSAQPGHLDAVARLAADFAAPFGAVDWARLAGLWHDLGKYSIEFQNYLAAATDPDGDGETAARGPDHSTAGARHAIAVFQQSPAQGRLLAYILAGHHAGLADLGDDSKRGTLLARLSPNYEICRTGDAPDLGPTPTRLPRLAHHGEDRRHIGFQYALFTRFLFSALIDADRLDTERFCDRAKSELRQREFPPFSEMRGALATHLTEKLRAAPDTPVNGARRTILESCRARAVDAPGFFTLDVATGGGKTLSSLAFALTHAEAHDLRRVVFAVPFTSIIEQTADEYRHVFRTQGEDVVLEHHSNLDPEKLEQNPAARLATENWDAPLIVTTNVQLLESLFAARTSRCRKLHRLARSVIVLDEAHLLPVGLLQPCLWALDELVTNYGCTVVLCSATQPAIARTESFPIGIAPARLRPLAPPPATFASTFDRVRTTAPVSLDDAALAERLRDPSTPRALCIVSTRRHAATLFARLGAAEGHFHLSALMCAAHRSEVIAQIKTRLRTPEAVCRVVSTQLVEAGVDFSFPVVYRLLAGLDSVAQAAGRCNREGELPGKGELVVFTSPETHAKPHGLLRQSAEAATAVLVDHADAPLSPAAVTAYFTRHYYDQQSAPGAWDPQEILSLTDWAAPEGLRADFREIERRFQLIEEGQTAIVVPHGEIGRALCDELLRPFPPDWKTLRRAQRYIVQVRPRELRALGTAVSLCHDRFYVLTNPAAYDPQLGLRIENASVLAPETLIVS